MQEEKICPYPGLRPFNDDESIFFRGRERNIETIIELFEKKKFMMLTGASGDGKSSLVYAGVVPHAKAGLFKAKYNNWAVADFRPERTPLDNLSNALNKYFKFENNALLKKELSFGFSSLINIYKKSSLYIDTDGGEWLQADDSKRKLLKRKASNLLIIADQFEEFFTNTENYNDGMASVESQAVINILLETAKTALAEDLPIYIICTMRSDYIGQCAAFRGLPEYIGFSQFFVPRLKRNEIQQVIEEPAQLNGDSISSRLTQRLLFDITEGYDQLPILQHALNQIWKAAENGKEEMDLLHYAMVGGLSPTELPPSDREKFEIWFHQLSSFKQSLFTTPSLENVLNAHANELLDMAYSVCIQKHPELALRLNEETTRLIIKCTFKCLTKIDDSRAVRNRMTLQEICNILNEPTVDVETLGKVLDIFREQGNTFIKPFISDDAATLKTHKHTILDITHESLIRNWDLLEIWAKEEHENYLNFQDFNKQLQRWIVSDKNSGYLLPIGPLTFFENWFETCQPNKYWLARYDETTDSDAIKLSSAENTLLNSKEFLKKSNSKLLFSRILMRIGATKLATSIGLLILLSMCVYYYFDFQKKQNSYIIDSIRKKGIALLSSNDVSLDYKADFLINIDRLYSFENNPSYKFEIVLDNLNCDSLAFDIAFKMLLNCQKIQPDDSIPYDVDGKFSLRVFQFLFKKFEKEVSYNIEHLQSTSHSKIDLQRKNNFLRAAALLKNNHFINTPKLIDDNILDALNLLYKFLERVTNTSISNAKRPILFERESIFNCITLILAIDDHPKNKLLLNSFIAPRINETHKESFTLSCIELNSTIVEIPILISASVYDTDSLAKKSLETVSSAIISADAFYLLYVNLIRHSNLPIAQFENYLDTLSKLKNVSKLSIISRLAMESANKLSYLDYKLDPNNDLTNFFFSMKRRDEIWDYYLQLLSNNDMKLNNLNLNDSIKVQLALYYKSRATYCYEMKKNKSEGELYFKKFIDIYLTIDSGFLENERIIFQDKNETFEKNYNTLLLYPKIFNLHPLYDCDGIENYKYYSKRQTHEIELTYSYAPLYFLTKNLGKLTKKIKNEKIQISFFEYIKNNDYPSDDNILLPILSNEIFGSYHYFETNFIKIYKGLLLWQIHSIPDGIQNFHKPDSSLHAINVFKCCIQHLKSNQLDDQFTQKQLHEAAVYFALQGYLKESLLLIDFIHEEVDKKNTLIDICYQLQYDGPIENTFSYLEKMLAINKIDSKIGMSLFRIMGNIGGNQLMNLTSKLLRKTPETLKPLAIQNLIIGIAERGSYYEALQYNYGYFSESKELSIYNILLKSEIMKHENKAPSRMKHIPKKQANSGSWNDADYYKFNYGLAANEVMLSGGE
ncbi:MAG TPA: hypothetical protein PLN13_10755 [Bacteroidia bacterium]|nr:hypothetical protein [Bacteroidia bacterium]HRH09050.1 hypothetical protein [Bacteroidia bacterium]